MWELILSFRQEMGVNIRVNINEWEISCLGSAINKSGESWTRTDTWADVFLM